MNKLASKHMRCSELRIHEVRERVKLQNYLLPDLAIDRCVRFPLFPSWLTCELKLDNVLNRDGKGKEE